MKDIDKEQLNNIVRLCGVVLIVVINFVFLRYCSHIKEKNKQPTNTTKAVEVVTDEDNKQPKVTAKATVTRVDSDEHEIKETFVVHHDNKTVKVPVSNVKIPVGKEENKESSNSSSSSNKAIRYDNEIDVSSLVTPFIPKWEVSVGVGKHHEDTYIPVGIQRDYTKSGKKAVRVEVHLDPSEQMKPNGVEVSHVWKF